MAGLVISKRLSYIYHSRRVGSRGGAVVRVLASHQCCPGSILPWQCHMRVKFVVGSRPCPEGFSLGSPVFAPFAKTNISKFQFSQERACIKN